jgi:uncharacterized protein YceH (UPF0502 family)
MHPFASLEQVDQELLAMAERDEPLVALLPRQPGRKEARFGQLLAAPAGGQTPAQALDTVVARAERAPDALAEVVQRVEGRPASGDGLTARVAQLEDEVADLRRTLDDLRDALERATGG